MIYSSIKHTLGNNFINIRGWKTNRKIIVIESDDWGAIRMPSVYIRNKLTSRYPTLYNSETYDRVDNLANNDDLEALFDVLAKFKDFNGKHPVITANTIVTNPDFEKIKSSGFEEYHYELFTETLKRYSSHDNTFNVWKQGMDSGVFRPQYHGREHLNAHLWLNALRLDSLGIRDAFETGTWSARLDTGERLDIAYNYNNEHQSKFIQESVVDGAKIFEYIFGYKSSSFIAPSYTWSDNIEQELYTVGVKYLQGGVVQILPQLLVEKGEKRIKRHFNGEKNKIGQIYLMRNAHFEPTLYPDLDSVNRCLNYIKRVFWWKKPAIISSHRLNFIGNIESENRTRTLLLLEQLLTEILKIYPDVEFMSSDQLGDLILNDN